MYAYIKGTIVSKKEEYIIIESSGIGYRIFCHFPMQDRFGSLGETACVYTYLYVREDTFALYGFPTQEEKDMFVMLLLVSGIGPKVAIAMVAQIMPSQFALAVITGDVKGLMQVKGVGKKGAERLILELKDKLKGFAFNEGSTEMNDIQLGVNGSESQLIAEAISAMVVLGYSLPEAKKAIDAVYKEDMQIEELIRLSLRALVR